MQYEVTDFAGSLRVRSPYVTLAATGEVLVNLCRGALWDATVSYEADGLLCLDVNRFPSGSDTFRLFVNPHRKSYRFADLEVWEPVSLLNARLEERSREQVRTRKDEAPEGPAMLRWVNKLFGVD